MRKVSGVFCSLLFGLTTVRGGPAAWPRPRPAAGPTTFDIAALTPDQDGQLAAWFSGMVKWQKYDEKWRNRPVHDYWERIVERKPPPAAPAWLPGHCQSIAAAGMTGFDDRVDYACRLVDDARARPHLSARAHTTEVPRHSSFLTRVHIDGLWTTTQDGARFYGIIGSHISLVDVGRVQVFGPPGVMLLTVPDGNGGRRVSLGYTWGRACASPTWGLARQKEPHPVPERHEAVRGRRPRSDPRAPRGTTSWASRSRRGRTASGLGRASARAG